ncbi:MAG: glycosyltransferase family 39 protein [Rhodocyclaceae bacterium]|nr:glycosyltransferase family 39 protein [Rhodocyclaceae bacterium]
MPRWLTPVGAAFAGSLLLSLVARLPGLINRDGILYVNVAQVFIEAGFGAAQEVFSWPFFPALIGIFSRITGLDPESAGYLLNALFMAGACALLVAGCRRQQPETAWMVCLTTLALPGLNEYRNELLREYGCWFFTMLAFWLAIRWSERPRWPAALAVQASLAIAALFRPEALALLAALIGWQAFTAPRGERLRRLAMIGAPALVGAAVLLILYATGSLAQGNRLAGDLGRLDLERFNLKAQAIAAVLPEFAQKNAHTILLVGSLAVIPVKFFGKIGIFLVPLLAFLTGRQVRQALAVHAPFAWGFGVHLLVLAVFVTDLQFLAGRYVAPLYLMGAPFLGWGLLQLVRRIPHWRWPILATAIILMFANVVSLSPGKTHFVDAGKWLSANATDSPRVYIESGRAAYYAGWKHRNRPPETRNTLAEALSRGEYDLLVLEVSREETGFEKWAEGAGLRIVQRFAHSGNDDVIVAEPAHPQPPNAPSSTERSR